MSYRFTIISDFLYVQDAAEVEAVVAALEEHLLVDRDAVVVLGDSGPLYVHGWFKTLSPADARARFDDTNSPTGFAVVSEWGEVWHKAPQAAP